MTRVLALPAPTVSPYFATAFLAVLISVVCLFMPAHHAHAQGLTDAQAQALANVVRAFSGSDAVGQVAVASLHTEVARAQAPVREVVAVAEPASVLAASVALAAPAMPLPTCALSASASSISLGQPVTLSWTSENATYASMPDGSRGPTHGSVTLTPAQTTTFGKHVYGPGGSAACQATVTVVDSALPPASVQAAAESSMSDLVAAAVVAPYQLMVNALTDFFVAMGVQ